MEWLIIIAVGLLTGIGTVEYQKARNDPPAFQSFDPGQPVFRGDIRITPDKSKVNT